MLGKACSLIREETIRSLHLHTKYHIYILEITTRTGQVDTKACSSPVIEDSPKSHENDPYPWLDEDDPRRDMKDEEILDKYIDLTNSDLTPDEKGTLMKLIKDHKQAFSLRDEISKCPDIKIDIACYR